MTRFTKVILLSVAALAATAPAYADVIVYSFTGTDKTTTPNEPEAFQLTTNGYISPVTNGAIIAFTCSQLTSSTNCISPGISFGVQSVLGSYSDQLQFDSPVSGSIYDFPTSSFTAPGVYSSQTIYGTVGTLTVTDQTAITQPVSTPEPNSAALMFLAGVLFMLTAKSLRLPAVIRRH